MTKASKTPQLKLTKSGITYLPQSTTLKLQKSNIITKKATQKSEH